VNTQEIIDVPITEIFIANPRVRNRKKWIEIVPTTVALAASYIPPVRAMRLDPITTLHSE
jgi:hypothetical protein